MKLLSKQQGIATSPVSLRKGTRSKNVQLFILALPAILVTIVFSYLPMGGIIIAFKDFKYAQGMFGSAWNGFENFRFFFQSNDALRIIRNTLAYNITFLLLGVVISVSLAMLIAFIKENRITRVYQGSIILPHLMSWVVVAYISVVLLDYDSGILNQVIRGVGGESISWYSEPKYWPFLLTFFHFWKGSGYSCLVYYSSIIGIDDSLYEAARLDGASTMQCIRHITLPMISNTIVIMLILGVGSILGGDFGLFYQLPQNSGFLLETTDVISTYNFRTLMVLGNVGVSASVGLMQSVIGMILVISTNAIARKVGDNNSLF